jgi:hypothetical protein
MSPKVMVTKNRGVVNDRAAGPQRSTFGGTATLHLRLRSRWKTGNQGNGEENYSRGYL